MSQTKASKLTLRNRPGTEGKISAGANVQVLLDDQPLKGVSFIKIEVKSSKVAKVTMEMYVEVETELYVELEAKSKTSTDFTLNEKPAHKWVVGTPEPALARKGD